MGNMRHTYLVVAIILIFAGAIILLPFAELLVSYQSHPTADSGFVISGTFIGVGPSLAVAGVVTSVAILAAGLLTATIGMLRMRKRVRLMSDYS